MMQPSDSILQARKLKLRRVLHALARITDAAIAGLAKASEYWENVEGEKHAMGFKHHIQTWIQSGSESWPWTHAAAESRFF
jgi:hypothetical protein